MRKGVIVVIMGLVFFACNTMGLCFDAKDVTDIVVSQPVQPKDGALAVNMDANLWRPSHDEIEVSNDVAQVKEGKKSLKIKISHWNRRNWDTITFRSSQGIDLSKYTTFDFWVYLSSNDPDIKKGRCVIVFEQEGLKEQQFQSNGYVPVNEWVHQSIDISKFQRTRVIGITPHFYFPETIPSPAVMTWYFDSMVFK